MSRKVTEADLVVGAKLLSQVGYTYNVVAGPDTQMCYVIQRPCGEFIIVFRDALMAYEVAPLCVVEGKPVYKGDRLYWPDSDKQLEVTRIEGERVYSGNYWAHASLVSWEPPCEEITGWIGVRKCDGTTVAIATTTCVYTTKEAAERVFVDARVFAQQVTLKVRK